MQYVEVAGRAVLVVVFASALAGKVSGRSAWLAFVASVRRMNVVGEAWTRAAAVATVGAEAWSSSGATPSGGERPSGRSGIGRPAPRWTS
ncbi:hypothetical protein [Dactylosporangium sp. NPDC051484]|uniref:hypothetical protein n=1 Tax=Dactylosporangium sp. NPDC051484 TaxID=3154942 RepID=UPI00344F3702